ncbi:MAG: ribonuclease P protein component [Saprospiraceae bacterium]|nr:ribonuclease P protein component [Saprospiraceae bacterium]MDW8229396.1 ribonuclease P protein component [Saprospiraceae bacterium]
MHTFERCERLRSRKLLGRLFQEGRSFMAFPVRVVWLPLSPTERQAARFETNRAQVAVSVPKRRYRQAVVRNRIRRQVREAYRLHKHLLYQTLEHRNLDIALLLIFVGKETPTFDQLTDSMSKLLHYFEKMPVNDPATA